MRISKIVLHYYLRTVFKNRTKIKRKFKKQQKYVFFEFFLKNQTLTKYN